jgi:ankyrin repeat protein
MLLQAFEKNDFINACKSGQLKVIKFLHKIGFSMGDDIKSDNLGETGLMIASRNGHLSVIKYLHSEVKCNNIFEKNNEGENLFMISCSEGHLHVVKYLIGEENWDKIDEKNFKDENVFTIATKNWSVKVNIFLMEHGFRPQEEENVRFRYVSEQFYTLLLRPFIKYRIHEINRIYTIMKIILPDTELLIIDLISEFTNGLKNLEIFLENSN